MENSEDAYFEKILANAAHLVEIENIDAANILKQCSLEIDITKYQEGWDDWVIRILSPREAFKILSNKDHSVTAAIHKAFQAIADTEKGDLRNLLAVPQLHDPDPEWRYGAVEASNSDEQLLASTVHYLLQGEEGYRYVAGLLKDCILTTEENWLEDSYGNSCLESLNIELRCPPATYDLLIDEMSPYLAMVQYGIEALLDKRYSNTKLEFFVRANLVQAKPGWRDELFVEQNVEQEVELVPSLSWIDVLRSQQQDFIKRLKAHPVNLLESNEVGFHTEITLISTEKTKRLRDFCWKMADKFKKTSSSTRDLFVNNLKGKLGEEAFSAHLGNFVTEVDYETRLGGDGKVDFKLTTNPAVGIQVKARNGNTETIEWFISEEEILENAVVACFLIQEEVNEAQPEYRLITAGFLPTNLIDEKDLVEHYSKRGFLLKVEDLLYGGGLRSYLEFLEIESQYLISKFNQEPQTESERQHLDKIWQDVVSAAQPPSTQMLLRQQGRLLELDDHKAVVFVSKKWFPTIQERVSRIEAAFQKVLERGVQVELKSTEES